MDSVPAPANSGPELFAGRYRLHDVLGRGGMATVHRAVDEVSGREIALKQLTVTGRSSSDREAAALFEREYRTLAQLAHPRVIEVYDFGIDDGRAYYTMELLDGRDLRELSPMPFRQACSLLFDVCSSLALLHSRRLVHRDVSPRNIRCTRGGFAKLIDFGALLPMSSGGRVVGTPAFVAPEVVHRLAIDARTDLYSVGATLYFALTGRFAYAARDFHALSAAWANKPQPPSRLAPDVPPALDGLVMSLLSLEPASRPRSAFEVMQRLAAAAVLERIEPLSVSQAYMSTPSLAGREAELAGVRARIGAAARGLGGGVLISGRAGVGRSRMLDACALEAKTLGAIVLHASAADTASKEGGVARALVEHLHEALPNVVTAQALESGATLPSLVAAVAREQAVVISVDDVHLVDAASGAQLTALVHAAPAQRVLLMLTADDSTPEASAQTLAVLRERCAALALSPLSGEQTLALLVSVFGDVPNVGLLAARLHGVSRGNPRECMDLAQHLIDARRIAYVGGSWTLPSSIEAHDLPHSAAQAFCERVLSRSPLARWLAVTQSLASHDAFTREQYAAIAGGAERERVDAALDELVANQILLSDGRVFALSHGKEVTAGLSAGDDPAERARRHRVLAELYAQAADGEVATIHHLLSGGQYERGLERLDALMASAEDRGGLLALPMLGRAHVLSMFERALELNAELGRPPREAHELRRWLVSLSIVTEDRVYHAAAPAWLAQLEHDSGLAIHRQLTDVADPAARLQRCLERVTEQWAATPEPERVYRPDEAIRLLVNYVAISIAIGARTLDHELIWSLGPLLEPFAPLSPLIEAMWQNALGTFDANCNAQQERARDRAAELYARLAKYTEAELRYVSVIRHALAYCVGAMEATLGLPTAMTWADVLDHDPLQQVNAMHIRKIARLQMGDAEGAERFRKQAELRAVQASLRQMFAGTIKVELSAYAHARDLTGIQHVLEQIEPLAAQYPGWISSRTLARAHFERLRGNLEGALAGYEEVIAAATPAVAEPWRMIAGWPRATASAIEVLVELGRAGEARARGVQALSLGAELGLGVAMHDVARALALAEAKLGDYAQARARLEDLIARQRALGIDGVNLGATYEARARIAIWAGDTAAVEEYGRLTAETYRHGRGSPLGAMYERLMDEARQAGVHVLPQLSEFESTLMMATSVGQLSRVGERVARRFEAEPTAEGRARCALQILCEAHGASGGYLYLHGERGFTLVAAPAGEGEPAGLHEFVTQYAQQEIEPELETMIASEASGETSCQPDLWHAGDGTAYRPLLLTFTRAGADVHAGVALLARRSAQDRSGPSTEVIAAVAVHLSDHGDAHPIGAARVITLRPTRIAR
jgi:tetratricopeptide (TPR) repeat protein